MIDLVKLYLQAGKGGDGKISFFRNRLILKGGPDGGNGGDGGNIVIRAVDNYNTLQHFSGKKQFIATDGMMGAKARKKGEDGHDVELLVPVGTLVWLLAENQTSLKRRQLHGLEKTSSSDEIARERFVVAKETARPSALPADDLDKNIGAKFVDYLANLDEDPQAIYQPLKKGKLLLLANLDKLDKKIILCQGGFGGRGNDAFKNSRHTTPMEAEYGTLGEQKLIFLELRLLANLGLVGFPNVGKSSFLRRLTKASVKVADYPFTTMTPHLGVWQLHQDKQLVIADIPGLIAGASKGKGLGFTFLRHIQNTQTLLFILSLDEQQIWTTADDGQKSDWLYQQYCQLESELQDYSQQLKKKKRLIAINKIDLYSPELLKAIKKRFAQEKLTVSFISVATGKGLAELTKRVAKIFT